MIGDGEPRVNKALFVRLSTRPGKGSEVEAFLRDGLSADFALACPMMPRAHGEKDSSAG